MHHHPSSSLYHNRTTYQTRAIELLLGVVEICVGDGVGDGIEDGQIGCQMDRVEILNVRFFGSVVFPCL